MGSCYSRKASKSQAYSSSATRMATARHDEAASRLARPTPYSRNIPTSKKLGTAIPKLEPENKAPPSKLSSIPRPSKVLHSTDEVDSNRNISPDSHLINNNNNLQPNQKTMPSTASGKATRSKSMSPHSDKTKIPSKLTAHITGLPRPQAVQTLQKSSSSDSFHEQESLAKNNNLSPGDNDEWDSGLGSSIIEKPSSKPDDAETLKDADESLEGSPLVSKSSNSVTKHILKFENIASLKADEIAKMNNSTPSLPKQHSYSPTYRSVFNYSKSTESYKKTFTDSYNNGSTPLTYGSYRNFLSYRKSLSANSSFSYWQNIDEPDTKEIRTNKPSKLPASVNKFPSASSCSTPTKSPKDQRKTKSSQQGSPESGVLSPVAELENRQFLIDDEISDQPGLISFQRNTLRDSVSELQALKAAANSDVFSSCSSLCSDDLMLDYEKSSALDLDETVTTGSSPSHPKLKDEKRHSINGDLISECPKARLQRASSLAPRPRSLGSEPHRSRSTSAPLRPPRLVNITECDDGYVKIDSSSYRLLCQDLNSVKTMLHRLKSIIYDAETLNPFDQVGSKNVFYQSMAHCDLPPGCPLPSPHLEEHKTDMVFVQQENADLRRQVVLLQQQLDDKDHTIRLLQQQMMKYANIKDEEEERTLSNSATQTDRLLLNCATSLTEELLPTSPSSTLVSFNLAHSSPNCTEKRALSKEPELPVAASHIPSIFVAREKRDPIVHNSVYL